MILIGDTSSIGFGSLTEIPQTQMADLLYLATVRNKMMID
jgi:hypothetical protein